MSSEVDNLASLPICVVSGTRAGLEKLLLTIMRWPVSWTLSFQPAVMQKISRHVIVQTAPFSLMSPTVYKALAASWSKQVGALTYLMNEKVLTFTKPVSCLNSRAVQVCLLRIAQGISSIRCLQCVLYSGALLQPDSLFEPLFTNHCGGMIGQCC
jgi:hypothetical protein